MMKKGGDGVISVTANIVPNLITEICSLALDNKFEEASIINKKLQNLYELLFIESNPVPAKRMLYKMNLIKSFIRLPLAELDAKYHENVLNEMLKLKSYEKLIFFVLSSICTSCSMIEDSDDIFHKKYDFLDEEIQEDIEIPDEMYSPNTENHYPVNNLKIDETLEIPKPRQIFASSGDSSVQLRRLGELMWIYIETLPSTSWPISKNYWDTQHMKLLELIH